MAAVLFMELQNGDGDAGGGKKSVGQQVYPDVLLQSQHSAVFFIIFSKCWTFLAA